MDSDRHRRISELFLAARELAQQEQSQLLERECATDPDLRHEIELLLASDQDAAPFLDLPDRPAPPPPPPSDGGVSAASALIGRRLGPYHILRVIAAGGMGTVYEALQDRPERRVAAKVLRRGLLSPSARRRFEHESEILGRLRHPGIAQVLAAGTWEDADQPGTALPYFVLELVPDARPLTRWCRERKLDLRARLELFIGVCDAVHHGHQKGVIHRDLKPGNLLVDDQGRPKVIDFGIARATDADLALTTQHTHAGELLGTLQYMSPEQCGDAPDDLDVRTDVYALGVILYELLTDALPYDVSGAPLARALELVRTAAPVRPSHVDRALRGDLETIVLKALAKEKTERYASAADLARDLGHFRRHEPIEARPPTTLYTVRKFVRRNRVLVAAGVLTVAGLVAGLIVALHGLDRAEVALKGEEAEGRKAKRQARIAEMTSEFLNEDLLLAAKPERGGRDTPIGLLLDEAAAKLPDRFKDEPLVASRLHQTIGVALGALGDYHSARRQFETAIERLDEAGVRDDDTSRMRASLGQVLVSTVVRAGRYDEALQLAAGISADVDRHLGARSEPAAQLLQAIGDAHLGLQHYELAEAAFGDLLKLREEAEAWGPRARETGVALTSLARCMRARRRFADAEPLLLRALDIHRNARGPDGLDYLSTMNNLGALYWAWGRHEQARRSFEDALSGQLRVLEPDHPMSLTTRTNLAAALSRLGENEKAVELFAEVVPMMRKRAGGASPEMIIAEFNWAASLVALGRRDESREMLKITIADAAASLPEDTLVRVQAMSALACDYQSQKLYPDAKVVWAEVLAIMKRSTTLQENDRLLRTILYAEGTLIPLEEYEDAELLLREAFDGLHGIDGERNAGTCNAATALARLYAATQRPDLASQWQQTAESCRPPAPAK